MFNLTKNITKMTEFSAPNPGPNYSHPEGSAYSGNRDVALRALLGTDYEFAHDSGLINLFYYNPDSGEDGLMHILGGEYYLSSDGTRTMRGFHHEPSADAAWIYDAEGNRTEQPTTYVDRTHLIGRNSRYREGFRERPYSPYHARVVIDGEMKKTVKHDQETGEERLVDTNNGMFPKEYDALAVMQAIRQAYETRDMKAGRMDERNKVIVSEGLAPMLDGEHTMKIRLVLDADSGKIVSAYPIVRSGGMKLTRTDIKEHLGV